MTVGLLLFGWKGDAGVDTSPRCFDQPTSGQDAVWARYDRPNSPPESQSGAQPLQLALLPEQATTLHFGRSQAVRALDIDYKLSLQGAAGASSSQDVETLKKRLGKTPVQLDLLQFRRSDGANLNPDDVRARARVVGDRVRVTLCVDRRQADALGGPGSYSGTVSIIDPRVARVDLPLVVDASDPNWARALALVVLAMIAGSWVTWVVKEQKPDATRFNPKEWASWSVTAIGIISVVAGAAAAVAIYQASYLSDPTWGVSVSESIALLTAAFVAFMGATTGLHVAGLADKFRREQEAGGHGGGPTVLQDQQGQQGAQGQQGEPDPVEPRAGHQVPTDLGDTPPATSQHRGTEASVEAHESEQPTDIEDDVREEEIHEEDAVRDQAILDDAATEANRS
ncbi:MAG: hypothetical protein HOQ22_08360 [Nocardioidaceae bacterium]|nr:hypothetical protein [Nocardioidaceae bacterium]NUS51032.1 hypothetical protein [Nocardioidaceae bacterium]